MVRRTMWLAGLALIGLACRSTTAVELPSEAAPGVASNITVTTMQAAGGQVTNSAIVFDSASGNYEEAVCNGGLPPSCPNAQRRTGTSDRVALDAAFQLTNTASFRSLRSSYEIRGNITPPDAHSVTITVVANGRRWSVSRDMRADYPDLLGRLDCRLQLARGALITCAS